MKQSFNIPKEVLFVTEALEKAGFEAYIVGGCVRDILAGRVQKILTLQQMQQPEEIQNIFPDTFMKTNSVLLVLKK